MAGYQAKLSELEALGARVIAGSVDGEDDTKALIADLGLAFPVAYAITRETADALGAWWDERRGFMQPSEFVLDASGKVLAATYSTGPIGRIAPDDAAGLIKFLEARKAKG